MNAIAAPRIKSLDGLRAVAILCVVAFHLTGAAGTPAWIGRLANGLSLGPFGVRLFFAISGFIITTMLVAEQRRNGRIALARFYVRRTLRLFPPLYLYVATVAVLEALSLVKTLPGDYLYALTYTTNFHPGGSGWYLGHTWSLSIEEQFYVLWPGVLIAAGTRRAPWILATVALVAPFVRTADIFGIIPGVGIGALAYVADWIALGALLALWRERLHARSWYARMIANPWTPVALVPVIFAFWTGLGHWRASELTSSVAAFATVLLIDAAVTHPDRGLARALNSRPLVAIGLMSYSLYLWQELFVNTQPATWAFAFPMNVLLAFAFATGSYWLVERPLQRARARFA